MVYLMAVSKILFVWLRVVVVENNVHIPSKDSVGDTPMSKDKQPQQCTSSNSYKYIDTGGGQDGAGPFIKESTKGDGRLWWKKMSLEKRVKERTRRCRAKSKRKKIPDSGSSMKKRST